MSMTITTEHLNSLLASKWLMFQINLYTINHLAIDIDNKACSWPNWTFSLHPLSEKYIFGKSTRGVQIEPLPPSFLRIIIPSKKSEAKYKKNLREMKNELSKQEYVRLYPGGSYLVKFYETTEVRKFSKDSTVDDILLRTFVWNFGTVTYGLAKYLTKLLSRLRRSHYTIKNTKQFVEQIHKKHVTDGYMMV